MATTTIRDALLASCKRRYTEETIEGLGTVRLQSLTELERAKVEVAARDNASVLRGMLIAMSLVDDEGNRLFGDGEVDTILAMDSRLTLRVSDVVLAHIGKDKTEDAVKNSETTPAEPVL